MDYQALVEDVLSHVNPYRGKGAVASYVPDLAAADPTRFGIALVLEDGATFLAGDAELRFSLQSISFIFALPLALAEVKSALWNHVGREPGGLPVRSLVQLELDKGRPRNPLTSAGALVVCDQLLAKRGPDAAAEDFLQFFQARCYDPPSGFDEHLALSESRAGAFNRSLAYFLAAMGNLVSPVDEVLSLYYRQCSLSMNCRQLAEAALFLAFDGIDPRTGDEVTISSRARRINALMMTGGHYDSSGEFAFRVGLPAKSSASGAILAVIPRVGAVCVWSPALNTSGSSLAGAVALERLVERTGWSVFA